MTRCRLIGRNHVSEVLTASALRLQVSVINMETAFPPIRCCIPTDIHYSRALEESTVQTHCRLTFRRLTSTIVDVPHR